MDHAPAARPSPSPRSRPVFARHAVSLLLLRNGASGPEVLMGVRTAAHRFMPNRLVFPGGAVDPGDATAPAATEPTPALLAMLARNATLRLARALAVAAARELHEETGLSLGIPPRLDQLEYLCRAVTPPASPIRFNARFLVAPADAAAGTPNDSHELQDLRWRPVAAVGKADVMDVTYEVLQRLQEWLAMPPAERATRTALHVFRRKSWEAERTPGFRKPGSGRI